MSKGHIKIARRFFLDDPWWTERREFSRAEAWLYLINLAQWRRRTMQTKYGPIVLQRGEFVASLRWLADEWRWGVQRVRTFLETAQKLTRVVAQRETQAGTVYLLANYERYQQTEALGNTPNDTPGNTLPTHLQHKNKQLSSKAVKKRSCVRASPDTFPAAIYDRLESIWFTSFGTAGRSEFRAAIKPLLANGLRAGQLERAMAAYKRDVEAKPRNTSLRWFAQDIQRWVREGDLCSLELMPPSAFGLSDEEHAAQIASHRASLAAADAAQGVA